MHIPVCLASRGKCAAERRNYIEGSFLSSEVLLAQASGWRGTDIKGGPCLLRFQFGWNNDHCAVKKWYHDIGESSATTFRTVQHRRDSKSLFYHEFLLIELNDGAICRIERTGEGSRVDAIRQFGCVANDYIQYFRPTTYDASTLGSKPSELVAEVHFPNELDIMDVLAICYAIYEGGRTRKYTLQRFNCYFFCGTILLALARRFLQWEKNIAFDDWKKAVNYALDRVEEVSRDPKNTELIFYVCRRLEPNNAEPADFILNALRDRLGTELAYHSVKQALARNLWRSTWSEFKNQAIVQHINSAIAVAIRGETDCARAFTSAIHDGKKALQQKHEKFAMVHKVFNKKATAAISDGVRALAKASHEQYRLEKIERPTSIFRDAWVSVASNAVGFWFPIQLLCSGDMEEWGFKELMLSSLRGIYAGQRVARMQARGLYGVTAPDGPTVEVARNMRIDSTATMPEDMAQANYEMAARSLAETLQALSEREALTPSNITIALYETLCKNAWDDWLNRSFRQLVGKFLPDMLVEEEGILVKVPKPDGTFTEIKSVTGYQEYMRGRIENHAHRVECYRLAAARLVTQDICETMTTVWGLIPLNYRHYLSTSI
ncbi:unnamed protein product [Rhizoctonia solani]|uniref:Uncharacterized protein n=1 Tax=Rhizoctonia solani TaxID=456999 RepID=A0A8H3C6Q4_9AGAM|nr:unnamed protein product [Rhizoctonia solani]